MLHSRCFCTQVDLLVRLAVARHVNTGDTVDVSQAIEMLFTTSLHALPGAALQDANLFRERFCYIEAVDVMLKRFEGSLRAVYDAYSYSNEIDPLRPKVCVDMNAATLRLGPCSSGCGLRRLAKEAGGRKLAADATLAGSQGLWPANCTTLAQPDASSMHVGTLRVTLEPLAGTKLP